MPCPGLHPVFVVTLFAFRVCAILSVVQCFAFGLSPSAFPSVPSLRESGFENGWARVGNIKLLSLGIDCFWFRNALWALFLHLYDQSLRSSHGRPGRQASCVVLLEYRFQKPPPFLPKVERGVVVALMVRFAVETRPLAIINRQRCILLVASGVGTPLARCKPLVNEQ